MSWEQLRDIQQLNARERESYNREPPAACPICGDLLEAHPDGRRNCPMGHYTWSGGPKQI